MARFTDNPTPRRQRYAVAKIVGYCEAMAASGLLDETTEGRLRERIAETLSAFNMEPHQEAVNAAMERT